MRLFYSVLSGGFAAALALGSISCTKGETDETPDLTDAAAGDEADVELVDYDVPFVPTPQEVVDAMLRMADVGPDDYVIDLGSGDGRIVMTAVRKHGARGKGVDLNPDHIAHSRAAAKEAGVEGRAVFVNENFFETDFSDATVVTMYLLSSVNLELRPRLLSELKPGTRLVSHAFDMGEWRTDRQESVGAGYEIYYWVVPAQVEGNWTLTPNAGKPIRLTIDQSFQEIEGTARIDGREVPLENAELAGDRISFTVPESGSGQGGSRPFEGHVNGNSINGKNWQARRE